MSHELVFQTDANGIETKLARLVLRKDPAWHGLGEILDTISLADIHRILATECPVKLFDLKYPDSDLVADDVKGLRWQNGTNGPFIHLGSVGPETCPLQNKDFVDALSPWLDNGIGEIESAGLLRGGSRIFAQIRVKQMQDAVIRTLKDGRQDTVRPFITLVNGHGKMKMCGGRTSIRDVCDNTVSASLKEMKADGLMFSATHRASKLKQGKLAEATADMAGRMVNINKFWLVQHEQFLAEMDKLRFLDSVVVKPFSSASTVVAALNNYAEMVDKGNKAPNVLESEYKQSKIAEELERLFTSGKGCQGQTWLDAHCAMTEYLSWTPGNALKGDRLGDAQARRMEDLWLGTRNAKLNAAMDTAFLLAKTQN